MPCLADHNSQKPGKQKFAGSLSFWDVPSLTASQHKLVGSLCRCVSNEIKLDDGNSPSSINT